MKTTIIRLTDVQKNNLGHITWTSNGTLAVTFADAWRCLERDFVNLLHDVEKRGELFVTKSVEEDGKRLELQEAVSLADEAFPKALVDLIHKNKLGSPRVFAVIDVASQEG